MHMQMQSWFDIFGLSEKDQEDMEGMLSSAAYLSSLVQKEVDNGIPPERIAIAGFSQGILICVCVCIIDMYVWERIAIVGYLDICIGICIINMYVSCICMYGNALPLRVSRKEPGQD